MRNARLAFNNKQLAELRGHVLNGCRLLDKRRPRWFEQIDLDAFDLKSDHHCICGQLASLSKDLEPGWDEYARRLGVAGERHGFVPPDELLGVPAYDEDHDEVWSREAASAYQENVWRREIKERRKQAHKAKLRAATEKATRRAHEARYGLIP